MISINDKPAVLPGTTQSPAADVPALAEPLQKNEEQNSHMANVIDGLTTGIDVVDLGVGACQVVADAVRPSHITGGKDALAGFVTGGGDGVGTTFQTVADCAPVAETLIDAADGASVLTDVLGTAGDLVSGAVGVAGDVVGSIVGGIVDGL